MENTLENKAKVFALYWGQNVMRCKTFNTTTGHVLSGLMNVDINSETIKENWFLELKPLSSISDEDAKEVAKYMDWEKPNTKDDMRDVRDQLIVKIKYNWVTWVCIDYLRSRGYALPWRGLSVKEQISYGWIKLKG